MRVKRGDYVEIVDNRTLYVVDKGTLVKYTPETIIIDRGRLGKKIYDARVHHFHGYMPPRLLVWRDEVLRP